MSFIIVYITHANEAEAKNITNHLLDQRLVACGNIFPISSAYWWNHKIENENEVVSIVKTRPENWQKVLEAVEAIHPYDVPCIMKIEAEANQAYENWIRTETTPKK